MKPPLERGKSPILFAGKNGGKSEGLDFWENEPRPGGPELSSTSPHMIGKVQISGTEYPVSVWVSPAKRVSTEGNRPEIVSDAFLTIRARGQRDASGNFVKALYGYGHAQNTLDGAEFPALRRPYVAAELTIEGQTYWLRGYVSLNGLDFMSDMGFTSVVENNARALLARKEAEKIAKNTRRSE